MINEKDIVDCIPIEGMIIHNILNNKGFDTYFVGGALRDIFINNVYGTTLKSKDWDLTTQSRYNDMVKLFNKMLRVNESGRIVSKNSSARLLIESMETTGINIGGKMYEVTPMNKYNENGEIEFTNNIEDDLSKRDFTINTIAYSKKHGLITSFNTKEGGYVDAVRDITLGIIRSTYSPNEAFGRNYYNIMRAIIFANRFGFNIEEETFRAMKDNMQNMANVNKGKLSIGFESLINNINIVRIDYLRTTGLLDVLCDEWGDADSRKLVTLLRELSVTDFDYIQKLRYIYYGFGDSNKIEELYRNFGVNKDIINRIKNKY